MKESALKNALMARLRACPQCYRVRKLADKFTRGLPDIQAFFCRSGELIVVEIECKGPHGKLSALQALEKERMRNLAEVTKTGVYIWMEARSLNDVRIVLSYSNLDVSNWPVEKPKKGKT